jgi:ABC-type uncharacterized transport system ATPase subunit
VIEAAPAEAARSRHPHLTFRGVSKRYGTVVATHAVDLEVARGSIHAIVGENGAGKTTLVGMAFGLVAPDAGWMEIDGRRVRMRGPHDAIRQRIGMVQQRFQLLEELTALENLVLGREPGRGPLFDRREALEEAERLARPLRVHLPWMAPARSLSVGQRQRLEILRLLYRDADLLILDEPTTVLTPEEVEDLFRVLRRLKELGRTIVFISHKLREVRAVADRVTIMRGGRIVATLESGETDLGRMAELMVGDRALASLAVDAAPAPGDGKAGRTTEEVAPLVVVEGLRVRTPWGGWAVDGVDLDVRGGEIVGLAGVEGNGQREIVEAVVGLRRPTGGSIRLGDKNVTVLSVRARRDLGLAFISEDRDTEGTDLRGSIQDTAVSLRFRRPPLSRLSVLRLARIRAFVRSILDRFGIRGAPETAPVSSLSGGNIQRLVLGRELEGRASFVVAAHPTRGVDIRGVTFVHDQLRQLRAEGTAVLLVSEELDELLALSDRLAILYEGRIVGRLDREAFGDRALIGRLIAGAGP